MILNTAMPEAARRAFEAAHQARAGTTHNRTRQKQTTQHDYRLTNEYREWRADEQQWRKRRAEESRERQASKADLFLYNLKKPRLTAHRLDFAQLKDAADKARIARARSPERVRAKLQRELNTACYEILKQRGLK